MGLDYYGILQIQRNSTDLEIKKANLALEFNPQRLTNGSSQQVFTLICEAYDILGDPLRRAVFDQYGEEGLKEGVPGPDDYIKPYHYHGDALKTYKEFFGTTSPYADLMDYLLNPKPLYELPEGKGMCKKQPPIRHKLFLTLHEIFFGGVKKMKIQRLEYIGSDKAKTEIREKILSIPIKPGLKPNTEIIFPEEGDQNPAHIPADIIFITEDKPHELFVREGNNLVTQADISLQDALLGTTITVSTIDHRTIRIPITDIVCLLWSFQLKGIGKVVHNAFNYFNKTMAVSAAVDETRDFWFSPGYEKVVQNEGMPILENPNEKGDLIIRFHVEYPPYLPKASRTLMQKAFYLAKIGGGKNQQEMINKMVLADKIMRVDPNEQLPPFAD